MRVRVVSVAPGESVQVAIARMLEENVGSVAVCDGPRLVGIFTERDVMRAVASDFDAAGHLVGQWMTSQPVTLAPDAASGEALELMLERGFRHLPIVDGGKVVGVVSIRDLTPRSAG